MKNSTFRRVATDTTRPTRSSAEWAESERTTLLMPLWMRREWAINRSLQLNDYERRRSPVVAQISTIAGPLDWARMLRQAA